MPADSLLPGHTPAHDESRSALPKRPCRHRARRQVFGGAATHAGDGAEQIDVMLVGGGGRFDLGGERSDRFFAVGDLGQDSGDEDPVLGAEAALEGLDQRWDLFAQYPSGEPCEAFGVGRAGHESVEHVPPGAAQDVGRDRPELDPVLEDLVEALNLPCAFLDLGLAVAGQRPQPANFRRWHEAGGDQPVFGDLADPRRVGEVLRPGTGRMCPALSTWHSAMSSNAVNAGRQ